MRNRSLTNAQEVRYYNSSYNLLPSVKAALDFILTNLMTVMGVTINESQTGRIDAIDVIPHHLISKAREERKITAVRLYLHAGTCNVTLKVNDAALAEATFLEVSTTPVEVVFTEGNEVHVDDRVALEISNILEAVYLYFQLDYEIL